MSGDAPSAALVWCPFPDAESAAKVADALLEEGLAACANILPGMISHFIWNGERSTSQEAGALFKTNGDQLNRLTSRLAELHPYDEPAVLGWRCDAAAPGALAWLAGLGR